MKHSEKNILFGLYDDEEELKAAVRKANEEHLPIMDVLTPFRSMDWIHCWAWLNPGCILVVSCMA